MVEADRKYADGKAPDLHPAQIEAYRRMTPEEKIKAGFRLYWQARKLKAAWLRQVNPDWTEREVNAEVCRIFLHSSTG